MNRHITRHLRTVTVALAAGGLGAGASAITSAQAAGASHPRAGKLNAVRLHAGRHHAPKPLLRAARGTVAGTLVVATKSGFATVTVARGLVQSVNGQQLTLVEGTPKQTYRTVTLTLPANVRVRSDGQASTLAQISGERALVVLGPQRALVRAHTPRTGSTGSGTSGA